MRSPLLISFLTAIALSGSANAAPIASSDLQPQSTGFTADSTQHPGQINSDPILLSHEDSNTKPLTGSNAMPEYLIVGSGTHQHRGLSARTTVRASSRYRDSRFRNSLAPAARQGLASQGLAPTPRQHLRKDIRIHISSTQRHPDPLPAHSLSLLEQCRQ